MIEFTVAGVPAPQGSKNQFGGESNPRTRPWRAAVTAEAARAMTESMLDGPVQVKARFVFPRPKSHYGSGKNAAVLKGSAPDYMAVKPDLDKLARALLDSLTGVCFRDDSQVAHLNVWQEYGEQVAGVWVQVESLTALAHHRTEEAASA